MVHDGDQNKGGGDVGEACIIASAACPAAFIGAGCEQCETNPKPGIVPFLSYQYTHCSG